MKYCVVIRWHFNNLPCWRERQREQEGERRFILSMGFHRWYVEQYRNPKEPRMCVYKMQTSREEARWYSCKLTKKMKYFVMIRWHFNNLPCWRERQREYKGGREDWFCLWMAFHRWCVGYRKFHELTFISSNLYFHLH